MDSPVIVDKASEFGEPIDLDRPFSVSGAISFFLSFPSYINLAFNYLYDRDKHDFQCVTDKIKLIFTRRRIMFIDVLT